MAPKYKLTYFDVTAKAETLRMLFEIAGIEFEDNRIGFTDFPKIKDDTPFRQLPVLEITDSSGTTVLCQTRTIARFLAKKCGWYGENDFEQAKIDMVMDCLADIRPFMEKIVFASEDQVDGLRKDFEENTGPAVFGKIEKMIENGHFNKDKFSMADIELYNLEEFSRRAAALKLETTLNKHPKLKDVIKNIEKNDKICSWLKKRPQSQF